MMNLWVLWIISFDIGLVKGDVHKPITRHPIQLTIGELRVASGGGILSKNVGLAPSGTVDIQASRRIEIDGFAPKNSNPYLCQLDRALDRSAG
jgi:hypothetical protein